MDGPFILVVEDEADIAELIRFHLDREGYRCEVVDSGRIAIDIIRRRSPQLIVLDLMLPDLDGLEVCRQVRWEPDTRHVPILIVSAKGEEADIVTGLELGADDYMTKPFSPRVLVARIRNVIRRARHPRGDSTIDEVDRIGFGDGVLIIDVGRREVLVKGSAITLTTSEFNILHYLASRPGFVRTRDQILATIRGEQIVSSRTVDVHVTALRRKMGEIGEWVETVRGVGYRFSIPRPEEDESS